MRQFFCILEPPYACNCSVIAPAPSSPDAGRILLEFESLTFLILWIKDPSRCRASFPTPVPKEAEIFSKAELQILCWSHSKWSKSLTRGFGWNCWFHWDQIFAMSFLHKLISNAIVKTKKGWLALQQMILRQTEQQTLFLESCVVHDARRTEWGFKGKIIFLLLFSQHLSTGCDSCPTQLHVWNALAV